MKKKSILKKFTKKLKTHTHELPTTNINDP